MADRAYADRTAVSMPLTDSSGNGVDSRDSGQPKAAKHPKVTKAELIDALHERSDTSRKDIHALIDGLFEEIKASILAGRTVELRGFGTFEVRIRKGRKRARNPKTGEPVSVEDHGVAAFRPGRDLKKAAWSLKHGPTATDSD